MSAPLWYRCDKKDCQRLASTPSKTPPPCPKCACAMKPCCAKRIWKGWAQDMCQRVGTKPYEGKWYCTYHHPLIVKKREAQREAQWGLEHDHRRRLDEKSQQIKNFTSIIITHLREAFKHSDTEAGELKLFWNLRRDLEQLDAALLSLADIQAELTPNSRRRP